MGVEGPEGVKGPPELGCCFISEVVVREDGSKEPEVLRAAASSVVSVFVFDDPSKPAASAIAAMAVIALLLLLVILLVVLTLELSLAPPVVAPLLESDRIFSVVSVLSVIASVIAAVMRALSVKLLDITSSFRVVSTGVVFFFVILIGRADELEELAKAEEGEEGEGEEEEVDVSIIK